MKKIQLVCVGRIKEDYFANAISEYEKRLSRYCEFSIKQLPDFPDGANSIQRESLSILDEMGGYSILTDINGQESTSEQFAQLLDKAFITSPKVQIIIGGSNGVSQQVKERASKLISFGRMTYPHSLMRVIVIEQIYRAMNILAGTAYHK